MKVMKFVFLFSTLSMFLLTSCLDNVGNSQTFPIDNAVVQYSSYYPGVTFLNTSYGVVAAPELKNQGYSSGDCMFVAFTVDYDNQPSSSYLTASGITKDTYKKIAKTNIFMLDAGSQVISNEIDALSEDSIKTVGLVGSVPCIDNNLFMGFDQLDGESQNYEYTLVYSGSLIDDVPVLYVCAKKSGTSSATPYGDFRYQAFDLTSFLFQYSDSENKFSFYLKYKTGVDAEGKNVYKSTTEKPITLTNQKFKDN